MNNILPLSLHKNANLTRIFEVIRAIGDPRTRRSRHPFESIIMIAICASIGGANNAVGIAQFGEDHIDWFKRFIDLPFGIPKHDTFNRVLNMIDARDMEKLYAIARKTPEINVTKTTSEIKRNVQEALKKHTAIDGKSLRALFLATLVRAFFSYGNLVFAQQRVGHGTNEITTIPIVLEKMKPQIADSIITIDAIGTQTKIVNIIVDAGGDYLLAVKGNQPQLHEDIKLYLDDIIKNRMPGARFTYHETYDNGHGRIEIRKCWSTENVGWLYRKQRWKRLKSISVIETTIIVKDKTPTVTYRYYISSLSACAEIILALVRNHWGIENKLHWSLNVSFREHIATTRKWKGAENMAILRATALTLLQQNTAQLSINNKRSRAACKLEYLLEVLAGKPVDTRTPFQKINHYMRNGFYRLIYITYFVGYI